MDTWQLWLIAAFILLVVEMFTTAFFAACVAVGCLLAGIAGFFYPSLILELALFSVGTLLSFGFLKPFMERFVFANQTATPTNADALKGRTGRVTEAINNVTGTGRVAIDGDDWKAVAYSDDETMETGERVEVLKVDSSTLVVRKLA